MPVKITKQQLAKDYGVAVRTVTNWMYKQHRISFQKIGRIVRFEKEKVEKELADSGLVKAKAR